MKQILFNYPINNIREEVEKRTSYLGRMRNTETEPHLLNRLSLTEGENFLFTEYLREAATETYNWIRAFGRNVHNAYELLEVNDTKEIFENGAEISVDGELKPLKFSHVLDSFEWEKEVAIYANNPDSDKKICIIRTSTKDFLLEDEDYNQSGNIYVYGWGNGTNTFYSFSESPKDGDLLFTEYEVVIASQITDGSSRRAYLIANHNSDWFIEINTDYSNKGTLSVRFAPIRMYLYESTSLVTYKYTVRYKTYVPNAPIEDECSVSETFTIHGGKIDKACEFVIQLDETPFGSAEIDFSTITSIDFEVIEIQSNRIDLHVNEYVEYHLYTFPRKYQYYIVQEDCTNENFMEHSRALGGDYRENIVYRLELPDWQDDNMLNRVRNSLREALVNYIMWRWFETTLPIEANVYYEKWETHAHNAQLGLNAEKKLLNRRYNMF